MGTKGEEPHLGTKGEEPHLGDKGGGAPSWGQRGRSLILRTKGEEPHIGGTKWEESNIGDNQRGGASYWRQRGRSLILGKERNLIWEDKGQSPSQLSHMDDTFSPMR